VAHFKVEDYKTKLANYQQAVDVEHASEAKISARLNVTVLYQSTLKSA
jgi:hypothetical protein